MASNDPGYGTEYLTVHDVDSERAAARRVLIAHGATDLLDTLGLGDFS